ncbi:MAG TPA: DUF3306 domain-containing protein [Pseudolabrys sp.]|nr:DUF3306 domain-containing protein [Pseudolabrys sp.]
MSETEKFLDRWSRRKREVADTASPAKPEDTAEPRPSDAKAAEVPFDPASLPPIDSLAADSDIRAFLQPGVPPELTRAALRRAWSADPAIRDFVGLVENGWDFNNPDAMPGFGPISAGDVAKLLAQVTGAPQPAKPDTLETAPPDRAAEHGGAKLAAQLPQDRPPTSQDMARVNGNAELRSEDIATQNEDIATQNNADDKDPGVRGRQHRHGGALPKL